MLVGAVTHLAVGKVTVDQSPGKRRCGSKMDRQKRRWTDRRGWQMWTSGRWPGEAAFCFCVGSAQTPHSNRHTNRGDLRPHSTANLLCGRLAQRWLTVGLRWHLDKVFHSGQPCKHNWSQTFNHSRCCGCVLRKSRVRFWPLDGRWALKPLVQEQQVRGNNNA